MEAAGEPERAAARDGRGDERRPQACRCVVDGRGPHADDHAEHGEPRHAAHQVAGVEVAPGRARQAREEHDAGEEGAQLIARLGQELLVRVRVRVRLLYMRARVRYCIGVATV